MPDIELIEETHQYLVRGEPFKSVTQIIEARHFCDSWYADKGKYVHSMLELYKKGILDESTLDGQLIPYLAAFKKFEADAPHIKGILDYKSGSPAEWHYLQTAAYRELWLNGIDENGQPLRNIKKGYEVMGFHPIYRYAGKIDLIDIASDSPHAYALYLKDTGNYSLLSVTDIRRHTQAFLTLVSAVHIRERYKI